MSVLACQHIRRMRGGANAHLMLADDRHYYVVKFRNNPQHPRILVNELISYTLLDYLQLPAPKWDIIDVPEELIEASPEMTMEVGRKNRQCEAGLHFASRFPVDPHKRAVYDYLPWSLLQLVINLRTFRGMVVFDKWVSNADGRQAVFFRDRASRWILPDDASAGVAPRSLAYAANMIDHGFAFNAQNWEFPDSAERGLYSRREVYRDVAGFDDFQPWLSRIENCPPDVLDDAAKRIPPEWFDNDWDALDRLFDQLYARRKRVADLVRESKNAERDPFPNWSVQSKHAVAH
jgi:hypothetical protein